MPAPAPAASQPLSNAVTRLWLPRPSLVACLRAVMSRDTSGVPLGEAQRWNHFPATPLCTLNLWFNGQSELLAPGLPLSLDRPRATVPGRMMFAGPQTRPTASWNPGPVHGMMVMLQPDAMHLMTGLEPGAWLDRMVDPRDAGLPADWLALCESLFEAESDDARVQRLEDFLDPRWQAVRPQRLLQAHRGLDWAQGLLMRAANTQAGRSLRQVERRIKQWTGQPARELVGLGKAERTFFELMLAEQDQRLNWAELAVDAGYADQSHLCRVTRRITGCTPEDLRRRINTDESFWVYRIWE